MSERRKGRPSEDIERIMRHYNCDWTEARRRLLTGDYELPERGTGLKTGRARE